MHGVKAVLMWRCTYGHLYAKINSITDFPLPYFALDLFAYACL